MTRVTLQGQLDRPDTGHYRAHGHCDQKGLAKVIGGVTVPTRRRILGSLGAALGASAFLAACGGDSAPAGGSAAAPAAGGASAKGEVRWQFRGSDEELKAAQSYVDSTFEIGRAHV